MRILAILGICACATVHIHFVQHGVISRKLENVDNAPETDRQFICSHSHVQ